ncbi:glutathione S-transferase family protein [Aquibium sp. A9E412]|uniref:glutathione S-transferase family protein n=1 Tax=Aquibium sp. A9E412 TaxID=2976767 RepID=UPI0025B1BF7A|nr:glutathione S-transferase family protein [Aquibium sp. A9E412]MDN2567206.1 glutathione S-transferase family protein [Aquibium sp. A9E412]
MAETQPRYIAVGAPGSRVTRVTWMLEELGQPYAIVPAKPHSAEMRRHNPTGKAPALVDGALVLTDSAAICSYLAERHPEAGFAPADAAERAALTAWLCFAQAEFEAPLWTKLKHRFLLAEAERLDVAAWTAAEFAREVRALEARLGDGPYALGARFSAADVVLGHCGRWARGARFAVESEAVNAYFDRLLARPALARALAREAAA